MSSRDLGDKTIIVTGGNGGIGKAIVESLANQGANIIIADMAIDKQWQSSQLFDDEKVEFYEVDLTDTNEVKALFLHVIDKYKGLTHLVNAIGIGCNKPFMDVTYDDFQNAMNVNLYSIVLCSQEAIAHFKEEQSGCIVNISSNLAYSCLPGNTPYTLTKAALTALTRTLAKEYVGDGITVNSVCPTIVKTQMFFDYIESEAEKKQISKEQFYEMCVGTLPQKRALEPEEVAHAVGYLCSEHAKGVTGQSLLVNGGSYMM